MPDGKFEQHVVSVVVGCRGTREGGLDLRGGYEGILDDCAARIERCSTDAAANLLGGRCAAQNDGCEYSKRDLKTDHALCFPHDFTPFARRRGVQLFRTRTSVPTKVR